MTDKVIDLYDKYDKEYREMMDVFFTDDSVEMRKHLQYYENLIDRLNYQLFIVNKKYQEVLNGYRKRVGLPVKEKENGEA